MYKRLLSDDSHVEAETESVLTELLRTQRFGESSHTVKRKKSLNVAAGKSISTAELIDDPSPSVERKRKTKKTNQPIDTPLGENISDDNETVEETCEEEKNA